MNCGEASRWGNLVVSRLEEQVGLGERNYRDPGLSDEGCGVALAADVLHRKAATVAGGSVAAVSGVDDALSEVPKVFAVRLEVLIGVQVNVSAGAAGEFERYVGGHSARNIEMRTAANDHRRIHGNTVAKETKVRRIVAADPPGEGNNLYIATRGDIGANLQQGLHRSEIDALVDVHMGADRRHPRSDQFIDSLRCAPDHVGDSQRRKEGSPPFNGT